MDRLNNEQKILEILTSIQQDISGLKQDVAGLKQDVAGLKQETAALRKDITILQEDVSGLKQESQFIKGVVVRIENVHGKKLDALFDGYSSNFDVISRYTPRLSALESKMDKLSFEVNFLKAANWIFSAPPMRGFSVIPTVSMQLICDFSVFYDIL